MNLDIFFASIFSLVTVGSFVALTVMTINLPLEQDCRQLYNSIISSKVIGVFYALMLIPAATFSLKGMIWTSVSIIALASVAAFSLTSMSNRINVILRKRGYC
jgi:hypothetical protein